MNEEEKAWFLEWIEECVHVRQAIIDSQFGKDPSGFPIVLQKAVRPFHYYIEEKRLTKAHANFQTPVQSGTPASAASAGDSSDKVHVTITGPKLKTDEEGRKHLKSLGFHFNAEGATWTGTIARPVVKDMTGWCAARGLKVEFRAATS